MNFTQRIVVGMVAGIIVGVAINLTVADVGIVDTWLVGGLFHVIGAIFVAVLKMLVVPLVFVSLVCGSSSLSDPKVLGRVGGKTIGLYLFTTGIAVTLALTSAIIFQPGVGATPVAVVEREIA